MDNKWADVCTHCGSTNTFRVWGKVGTYVSYYKVVCRDCNKEEPKRSTV